MRNVTGSAAKALDLAGLLVAQEGVASRAQLRGLGCNWDQISVHLAAGRWQLFNDNVVVTTTGALTGKQLAWAAVLDGGTLCAIAGISALRSQGLVWYGDDQLHVAGALGFDSEVSEGLVRRQSRRLCPEAIHPVKQPPIMRKEVALVDALENIDNPLRGCGLMAAVVQQRLFRPTQLLPLIQVERTLPGRQFYLRAAADIEGGAQSLAEINFVRLARRAGVRHPVAQSFRKDRSGKRRYLDADFGGFVAEVDGGIHLRPLTWIDDLSRQNEIVIDGRPVLRFTSVTVRVREAEVIDQLRRADRRYNR